MKVTYFIHKVSALLKSIPAHKMNTKSGQVCSRSAKDTKGFEPSNLNDLSPVTNLTLNLIALSTSVAGTPIRRISWSNPLPGGNKIGLNPEDIGIIDSPTLQEILSPKNKSKRRLRKCTPHVLPSDSEDDKENVLPYYPYHRTSKKSDDNIPSSSQDSGYSGISEQYLVDTPPKSSFKNNQSYVFTDDEDGFDNIFQLAADEEDKFLPVPMCMSSLLRKPLSKIHQSPKFSGTKSGKLPIRRCLSMDMDSESDSSSSESTSKIESNIASSLPQGAFYAKLEASNKTIFKRPDPPNNYSNFHSKRRKSSPCVKPIDTKEMKEENFVFHRSYSETSATIMHALLKADLQPELVGDGSRLYGLPLVVGRHQDLKSIAPATLAGLIKGDFKSKIENFTLIDCRYPYEFEGGHICGAKNIYTKEDIMSTFFENPFISTEINAVIFHCEFSSERAPSLYRFLRNKDREINEGHYPRLHHPEIYILEGGYKAFFECHKELCEPQDYKPMNHKDHGFELRHFRAKSKSWGGGSKGRSKLRSNSKPTMI